MTAGDFVSDDQTVEVMNLDHKVCTLGSDITLELEATVNGGKGYVLADRNKSEEMPIGMIPIDSVFSPIRRVNYTVTPARVGRETDFDKLTMEIWTERNVAIWSLWSFEPFVYANCNDNCTGYNYSSTNCFISTSGLSGTLGRVP